jgi:DNA-binding SARP family transcriptional activator
MRRDQRWSYRSKVEFTVLGPLQVSTDRGPVDIAGVKERTLLAHLVAAAGRMVTTDELIDSLWGDAPPRTAAKSCRRMCCGCATRLSRIAMARRGCW